MASKKSASKRSKKNKKRSAAKPVTSKSKHIAIKSKKAISKEKSKKTDKLKDAVALESQPKPEPSKTSEVESTQNNKWFTGAVDKKASEATEETTKTKEAEHIAEDTSEKSLSARLAEAKQEKAEDSTSTSSTHESIIPARSSNTRVKKHHTIMLILFVVALAAIILLVFWNKSDKNNKIRHSSDRPGDGSALTIKSAIFVGDKLKLEVDFKGGCKTHDFELYADDKGSNESLRDIHVYHDANEDDCDNNESKELEYDLSELTKEHSAKLVNFRILDKDNLGRTAVWRHIDK